jgi:hypothetical protein
MQVWREMAIIARGIVVRQVVLLAQQVGFVVVGLAGLGAHWHLHRHVS